MLAALVLAGAAAAAHASPRPAAAPFACAASVAATPLWKTGNATAVALALDVTNAGGVTLPVPWSADVGGLGEGARILALFDALGAADEAAPPTSAATLLSLSASHYWQALPAGATTSLSSIVEVTGQVQPREWTVSVAGVACAVEQRDADTRPSSAASALQPLLPDLPANASAEPDAVEGVFDDDGLAAPGQQAEPDSQRAEPEAAGGRGHAPAPVKALTTRAGQLIDARTGAAVYLAGVNVFGFDTPGGTTFIDGLWAGNNGLTGDFATVVYRLQLLGFNAVRLPFSFKELYGAAPRPVARRNCPAVSPRTVAAATAPPGTPASVLARAPRPGPAFATNPPGVCSSYVPTHGVSVADRLAWTADYLVRNGFYVVLDYQLNVDQSALEDTGRWVRQWADLARLLVSRYPRTAGRMLLDVMNEPDAAGLSWQARAGGPGAGDLYLQAMDAIHAVWPGFVMLFEGCGQYGLARNWGDGLATEDGLLSSRRLSDPRPFLSALIRRPYVNQVAAAPHVYPYSVSGSMDEGVGGGLYWRLSSSAGYLNRYGFCSGGTCHRFPVIIGETGSAFTDARDLQTQLDLIKWATLRGDGADGRHNRVSGLFLWAWNGNSGSGHGLVDGSWLNLDFNKVSFAAAGGAVPWYARGGGGGPGGQRSPLRPVSIRRTGVDEGDVDDDWAGAAAAAVVAGACANASSTASGSPFDDDGSSTAVPPTLQAPPPLTLRGVAWPGFDSPAATLAGLEDESLGDGVARLKALGFTAVTLPLSLAAVLAGGGGGRGRLAPCAPPANNTDALAAATRPPGPAATAAADGWTSFPSDKSEAADAALSAATAVLCGDGRASSAPALDRLAAAAAALSASGLAVVLEDADPASPAASDPAAWVSAWATVAAAVHAAVAGGGGAGGFLAVRPLANPDALALTWSAGLPGLYLSAMDAVAAAAPGAWLLAAGAGLKELPGAGFPADDPGVAAFLTEAGARGWGRRFALSPRLEVRGDSGADPASLIPTAFGHLDSPGVCGLGGGGGGGGCRRFPLILGAVCADLRDAAAARALARCIATLSPGCGLPACNEARAAPATAPLAGWVWGAWVGGDGGAATPVLSSAAPAPPPPAQPLAEAAAAPPAPGPSALLPPIHWPLISALTSGLGLAPWFLPPTAHRTSVSGGWAGPLPAGMEGTPSSQDAAAAAAGPGGAPSQESAAVEDAPPPPACLAAVSVAASGPAASGDGQGSTAGLVVIRLSNKGSPAILPPYRLSVVGPPYTSLLAAAGMEGGEAVSEESGEAATTALTGLVTADAAALWPHASNTVSVALAVSGSSSSSSSLAPTAVSINGAACEVETTVQAEEEGSGRPVEVVSVVSARGGLH